MSDNELINLPSEIGQLRNLGQLQLQHNQLRSLPPEIGQLMKLCFLDLSGNNFSHLPNALGNLSQFAQDDCAGFSHGLLFYDNPLISPPPQVIAQGIPTVLAYLRNQGWYHTRRLIVGSAAGIGLLTLLLLGFRLKQQSLRKPKHKRDAV